MARTHRSTRGRRLAVRVVGPTLALLLIVAGFARPVQADTATSGATWSRLMSQKLNLEAESARLTAQLPGLRAAVSLRTAELTQAQRARTAAASTLVDASAADESARSAHAAAMVAAAAASSAVIAAQKRRPLNPSEVVRAKRDRTAANAEVRASADRVDQVASALTGARRAYTVATHQLATATTAQQTATQAVSDTRQQIAALPPRVSDLAAQATAISQQVVTETRANFTTTQTTQVYGITVNKIIAGSFQQLIDDASRAGVALSGGGFRTRQQQIALRIANGCPDIWTAPASSCRVPTAIPGRSLHELGLAIDLTSGGKTVNDRNSPAFKWLTANAGRYGLVNLPSEAWHWSITGG